MRPKVKYAVIYRHRNEYSVSVMCRFFEVSRSGYYDFVRRIGQAESDAELAKKIQECQDQTDKTYGYRRVWKWLKDRNIERNPKTVLRVMKKYGLLSVAGNGLTLGYFKLTQSYGITPSMSRKGNPYDNAMAENFFSILKTECIYRHKPNTFREANNLIDRYIYFYNHERIQNRTGVAPLTLRHSA